MLLPEDMDVHSRRLTSLWNNYQLYNIIAMNKTTNHASVVYERPQVQLVEICLEQCIASSCSLGDMGSNEVYDEEF